MSEHPAARCDAEAPAALCAAPESRAYIRPDDGPEKQPALYAGSALTRSRILLVDNGSLEPASTRQLRSLAAGLSNRVNAPVVPVSIAHSSNVPADLLDGQPAELYEAALDRMLREGASDLLVVPLFVGPSYAIVRHVPALIAKRRSKFPAAHIALAPPLFVPGEVRVAQILAAAVREQTGPAPPKPAARLMIRPDHQSGCGLVGQNEGVGGGVGRGSAVGIIAPAVATPLAGTERPRVAIVDHGSPSRAVTEVRDVVAAQVRDLLGDSVEAVAACSMERREGPEFAFNEPLLERLLAQDGWREGPVIVALLFIAPGRHAGPDGDVARIVMRARNGMEGIRFTPVLGTHPLLLDILAERVTAGSLDGAE